MATKTEKAIADLTEINGLAEKMATRVCDHFGAVSVEDVVRLASEKQLQKVSGIGPASEKKILTAAKAHLKAVRTGTSHPKTPSKAPSKRVSTKTTSPKTKSSAAAKPKKQKSSPAGTSSTKVKTEQPSTYRKPIRRTGKVTLPRLAFKLVKKIVKTILP